MRSLVKVLVITLLVGFVGAQFLPDVIHVPKRWPPRLPRVEFVREGAAVDSTPAPAPVAAAPVAAAPPETVATPLPQVAAAPSLDAAKSARQAKRKPKSKPKPRPPEFPEEDGAWFSTEPTAMIVPVRITTQVELTNSSREIPTPPAPEIKTGDEWPVLCGEIVDSTGVGVDGADVRIESTDISERTDPKGRFCFPCPTRKLTLLVGAAGRESVRHVVELEGRHTQVRLTLR